MTVEEVRGSLDLTDNGAIKNSIRNCLTVFQNDPVLQGAVRYNILTERIDIVKPLWWSKQTATLTDTDLNYLMLYGVQEAITIWLPEMQFSLTGIWMGQQTMWVS